MDRILKKLVKQIDSMNSIAKKVIKYGFLSFQFIIFSCLIIAVINKYFLGNIQQVAKCSMDVFKSSFSALAIIIIGGLVMDYIARNE